MQNNIEKIINNIEKVIIGKKDSVELLVLALICQGHVLIEDVPGTGKTTLALALAKSIEGSFKRVSCTPDVMPSDITGFSMFNQERHTFEYQEGAIMTNVFLADEINRTPPKTQAGLLEAMEENKITVDGINYPLPQPFIVIATQNPIEYLGTYPLPEAQLDRFLVKISLGYPSAANEKEMMNRYEKESPLVNLQSVLALTEIDELQKEILNVELNDKVKDYIVSLVKATRDSKQLKLGISPRGTLSIGTVARAYAYYQGRDYVIPDDVKKIFIPVCSHRIVLMPEIEYDGTTGEDVLKEILNKVKVLG